MTRSEQRETAAVAALRAWVAKRGHDRCHYHPDILNELARIFEIDLGDDHGLPSLAEFQEGCRLYQTEQYGREFRDRIYETRQPMKLYQIHYAESELCMFVLAESVDEAIQRWRVRRAEIAKTTPEEIGDPDSAICLGECMHADEWREPK